jgi:hypothetical protein
VKTVQVFVRIPVELSHPERFIRFVGDTVRFTKEVVPTISAEYFASFGPIFESVEKIDTPVA